MVDLRERAISDLILQSVRRSGKVGPDRSAIGPHYPSSHYCMFVIILYTFIFLVQIVDQKDDHFIDEIDTLPSIMLSIGSRGFDPIVNQID